MNLTPSPPDRRRVTRREDSNPRPLAPSRWPSSPAAKLSLTTGVVQAVFEGGVRLEDGTVAKLATSCWLEPEVGDRVCCLLADDVYVTHVLARDASRRTARVALPGIDALTVAAREIAVTATRKLSLASLVDCEVVAATGTVTLTAQNIAQSAANLITHAAEHVLVQAGTISQRATDLWSALARRHLLVAEKEVRVDGDIIQMG